MTNIKDAYQKKLVDVRNEISDTITEIETNNYFEDLKSNINQSILDGSSLQELSINWNLNDIKSINNLTKDFKDYEKNENIFYKSLISNSFATNKDYINDVVELDSDTFYVFKVDNIESSKLLEYDIIKNNVEEDWKISKKIEKIEKNLL